MTFEAHVLLKRPGRLIPIDIGVKEVEPRPIRFGKTAFKHDGKAQVGRIEKIEPHDWERSPGTIPRILVVQD